MTDSPWAKIRTDYAKASLDEKDVAKDPTIQLEKWLNEAIAAHVLEPTAMTLATSTKDGKPSARIVLCKGLDAHGITFFTNYESKKGRALLENAFAALVFFWPELERQVRVEGRVAKTTEDVSRAYFDSRPAGSRIGAIASAQSRVVESRAALEARFAEVEAELAGKEPALPFHWGGYILTPDLVEFWQGRASRMHDRVQYTRDGDNATTWSLARLCP